MPRRRSPTPRAAAADALHRSTGALSSAAMARMESDMAWFRELSAEDRSWVGVIVQAGVRGFVDWYRQPADVAEHPATALAASVFGAAPRALTGVITLRQTVDLVRLSIEVVEAHVDELVDPADAPDVHAAILHYAREVAFATAEVYARAAEQRGAWDARLEALVVDAVLRSEPARSVVSRASALGWRNRGDVAVVLGSVPERRAESDLFEDVRRAAREAGLDALCAVQGDHLVVVLGGLDDPLAAAATLEHLFGEGPVVVGPAADSLQHAHASAHAAVAAHRAAPGWPGAPRPVRSADLVVERVLAGDVQARRHLVEDLYRPLVQARGTLVETLTAYFASGGSVEATARAAFIHPNTVRYRLRQVAELTGLEPPHPRDGQTLRMALVLGRLADAGPSSAPAQVDDVTPDVADSAADEA